MPKRLFDRLTLLGRARLDVAIPAGPVCPTQRRSLLLTGSWSGGAAADGATLGGARQDRGWRNSAAAAALDVTRPGSRLGPGRKLPGSSKRSPSLLIHVTVRHRRR